MEQPQQQLPTFLYHWTEAMNVEMICCEGGGLRTSVGGFCGEHEDEPGVNLTSTGLDPAEGWNENIFHLARPVRLTIDTSRLEVRLLGPDLNSLFEDGVYGDMQEAGVDPDDPQNQTWQQSLHFSGNVRYLAEIAPELIVDVQGFLAPHEWKIDPADRGYHFEYDAAGKHVVAPDWHVKRWPGRPAAPDLVEGLASSRVASSLPSDDLRH